MTRYVKSNFGSSSDHKIELHDSRIRLSRELAVFFFWERRMVPKSAGTAGLPLPQQADRVRASTRSIFLSHLVTQIASSLLPNGCFCARILFLSE